jgi:hypothetical protein
VETAVALICLALLPAFFFVTGYRRSMESVFFKIALLVTAVVSIGGWVWLLGVGIRWLIVAL